METERFMKWKAKHHFRPTAADMIFIGKTGFYSQNDRVALIIKWRDEAERAALNAILIMMCGDFK